MFFIQSAGGGINAMSIPICCLTNMSEIVPLLLEFLHECNCLLVLVSSTTTVSKQSEKLAIWCILFPLGMVTTIPMAI